MPQGMFKESKMMTVPWDKPKRESMDEASLQPPSPLMPEGGATTSLYYDIFHDPGATSERVRNKLFSKEQVGGSYFRPEYEYTRKAGGGLIDKKDALMAYYGGGRVNKKKKKQKRGY